MREGYIVASETDEIINYAKVNVGDRMKATLNAETRSSENGGLFLYRFIEKVQFFVFEVRSKDETYLKKIKSIFHGKESYFGKSKSAEFGEKIKITYHEEITFENADAIETHVIYAESNLCFLNKYGEFTTTPTAEQLTGNAEAKICWQKSQIRFRTYYPFNGHRETWDFERLIIEKGSVFVLKEPVAIDTNYINNGIGCFLSEGFGRVLLNPAFLSNAVVNLEAWSPTKVGLNSVVKIGEYPIYDFLKAKNDNLKTNLEIHNMVEKEYHNKFSIRITSTQCSRVYSAAVTAGNAAELQKILFTDANSICKSGARNPWSEKDIKELEKFLTEHAENQLNALKILAKKMRINKKMNEKQPTHELSN